MAAMKMTFDMPRRPITFKLPFNRPERNLLKGVEYKGWVLGLGPYQFTEGDDVAYCYFIVELESGECIYIDPDYIKFMDTQQLMKEGL